MLLFLLACTPLVGEWSGQIDCVGFAMDVEATVDWDDGYVGEGEMDCSDYYGASCTQTFAFEIDPGEVDDGEQELEIDVDDCMAEVWGVESEVACDDPDDVVWDGANEIQGEWSGCELELNRD